MAKKPKSDVDDLAAKLTAKEQPPPPPAALLSSGSTLLNLACSGKAEGAFYPGHVYLLVGDSNSGKSFTSMTCMAEAANHPNFENYRLILDNPENSVKMDVARFFGAKMAAKLETLYSGTVEQFYDNVDDACKQGTPFVYVLDSMDALSADDEVEAFEKAKEARKSGKDAPDSYGTSKAKANSQGLRLLMDPLRKAGGILIVICQTRDNIGFSSRFQPKTRSGGKSLKFYTTLEIWTSVREQIKDVIKGKTRQLGILATLHVKKNRLTGRDRQVEVPIYHSSGIDDVGSLVDWLVEEGRWSKVRGVISAPELDFLGKAEDLVRHVEAAGLESRLKEVAQAHWDEIEAACRVERKSRYQ